MTIDLAFCNARKEAREVAFSRTLPNESTKAILRHEYIQRLSRKYANKRMLLRKMLKCKCDIVHFVLKKCRWGRTCPARRAGPMFSSSSGTRRELPDWAPATACLGAFLSTFLLQSSVLGEEFVQFGGSSSSAVSPHTIVLFRSHVGTPNFEKHWNAHSRLYSGCFMQP